MLKTQKLKTFAILLLLGGSLTGLSLTTATAVAAPAPSATPPTPSANQSGVNLNVLPSPAATSGTVGRIIDVVFVIIGSFALLNITLSGLKYITSAGNEQKTAEAKNGIVYSLVGLVIAIAAEAIVAFVVHRT